jgi:ABC-type branched-subunit amino acid transport system substrate-binding protein
VGYSAAQAIVAALQATKGDPTGSAVRDKLNGFQKQHLLVGPTTFTSTEHIPLDRPMVVLQYTNGAPHYLTRQAPEIPVVVGDS